MEDSHIAELNLGNNRAIFGVFDGHGGSFILIFNKLLIGMEVAEFVKRHFVEELKKNSNFKNGEYEKGLKENFLKMDKIMLTDNGKKEI